MYCGTWEKNVLLTQQVLELNEYHEVHNMRHISREKIKLKCGTDKLLNGDAFNTL